MAQNESRSGKRSLRALSAEEKLSAIQRVLNGESKASVARDIGVPESTLRGWCKSEQKIRGMAHNSSASDSGSHSSASSSGGNPLAIASSNLSRENDGLPGPSKKIKLEEGISVDDQSRLYTDAEQRSIHECASILNRIITADLARAMLMQQFGPLSFSNGLNYFSRQHLSNSPQMVGPVENGPQHTENAAIAPPTCDQVSETRESLSPAPESHATHQPVSPEKSIELQDLSCSSRNSKCDDTSSQLIRFDHPYPCLPHQRIMWKRPTRFIPKTIDASRVGNYQESCILPNQSAQVQPTELIQKSPTKAEAALDDSISNSDNIDKNCINGELEQQPLEEQTVEATEERKTEQLEEAIEHGEKLLNWLREECSVPEVTQAQIKQLRCLLENLKSSRNRT